MAVAENIKRMASEFYRLPIQESSSTRPALVIGLGHKARNGKDTVVAHLVKKYAESKLIVKRYAFADALKHEFMNAVVAIAGPKGRFFNPQAIAAIRRLENWAGVQEDHQMELDAICTAGKPRHLLQWWGGEFRRQGLIPGAPFALPDYDYWVRKVQQAIVKDKPHVALIADTRYVNEAAICDVTIRVERKGFSLGAAASHSSETELDTFPYDHTLSVKEGDIAGLCRQAEELFDNILFERRILLR
jgi:hypothetical protein